MTQITRFHTKHKSDVLEQLTGIRVVATEYIKRPGEAPLFVRVIPAPKNR